VDAQADLWPWHISIVICQVKVNPLLDARVYTRLVQALLLSALNAGTKRRAV
jgi:hypothetical protein